MFNCRVCLVLSWLLLKVFLGPVLHIHPDTVDCRAAAALLLLLLCEVFETQRVGVTCWWGGCPVGGGPLTSGRPPCPPAGCPCHRLTDGYKVTTVCSEVLTSPLSLSCPRTKPDCPSLSTCCFVSLLNYRTSWSCALSE